MMTKRTGILALLIIALAVFWMRPEKRSAGRNADAGSFILSAHAQTSNYGGVSITSFAANCVPIAPTASSLACGALSDNGTVVTSTEQIQGANNTLVTAPTYSFAGNSSTGIYNSNTQVRISSGGSISGIFSGTLFTTGVSGITFDAGTGDTFLARRGAANLRMGAADLNGTPVDQTLSFQNAITGTDLPGGHFTIDAPIGTGAGAGSKTCLNRALMRATGTTAQSATNGFCVGESKTLSNTTATTTALVNISVPSNSSGGSSGTINVSCNDGTNFDSETVSFVVSYVNKATVLTIGTVQLTTASTANNSGSCTTAVTATAGTNSVNINVTPVITTIVPTTVTGTVLSLSSYATGNVTVN